MFSKMLYHTDARGLQMGDFPWRHVRRFIVFLEFLEMRIGNFQERQVKGAECVSLVIP